MDKFAEYKLEINEKNKNLVIQYLQSIKKHVENNGLENDCYEDIEEMFFEKLSSLKQINELNIKKIIQEVGEPEIIFGETKEKNTKNEDNLNFYQKLKVASWEYDNDGAIILGISGLLGRKFGLNTWIIRIILLLFIIFGGISIWLYFLFGIILPIKTLNYNSKNITNLIKIQIIYVIKKSIKNIIKSFFLFFPFLGKKLYNFIKIIFKNILPIIRFIFFVPFSIFLIFLVFLLIFILSLSFTNFTIGNIDFLYAMPNYLNLGLITGIISLSIFAITFIYFGIKGKNLNGYIISIGLISFLIALFLCFSTIFDLIGKYSNKQYFTQKTSIQIEGNGEYGIHFNEKDFNYSLFLGLRFNSNRTPIKLINYDGDELILETNTKIYGNNDIFSDFTKGLSEINLTKSNGNIIVNYENNNLFKKNVPFTLFEQEINLYIPNGVSFNIYGKNFYYLNAFLNEEYNIYKNYLFGACHGNSLIFYSNKQENFVCNPSESELEYAKKEFNKNSDTVNNFLN